MEAITAALVDSLGINAVGLAAQIVNFSLLMLLLYMTLYKPVVRMLDQRAERVKLSMEQAEEVKKELARARDDYEAHMKRARGEAQDIVARSVAEGERMRSATLDQGRREAEAFLARARAQIERDREEASRALRAEVADLALAAAGRVVSRTFDEKAHYDLVDEVLQEMEHLDLKGVR